MIAVLSIIGGWSSEIMQSMAAKEAKTHFGELMDTVQREPDGIEKYGRPVAVMMTAETYKQFKLERLKARLWMGAPSFRRSTIKILKPPILSQKRWL